MKGHALADSPRRLSRRVTSSITAAALASTGLVAVNLTTMSPAHAESISISNAELRWGINAETTSGAYAPGTWNLMSAGKIGDPGVGGKVLTRASQGAKWSNDKPANWKASEGNVTIEDLGSDNQYRPTTWEGTRTNAAGTAVNTAGVTSENVVTLRNGQGKVDVAAKTGSVQWKGDFSVIYYSGMSFFYVSNPKLDVAANGTGKLTATLSGYGSSMSDMNQWTPLAPTEVTLADMKGVRLTEKGVTVSPEYKGVTYDAPENGVKQSRTGDKWGAFPTSFLAFQEKVGSAAYWYSSGGAADGRKTAADISIQWSGSGTETPAANGTVTVSKTTVAADGSHEVTVKGSGFDPRAAIATRPPLAGKPGGVYVVFGKFAKEWAPSAGAAAAARVNSDQKWAVSAADMQTIGGAAAGAAELTPQGTFETTLRVDKSKIDAEVKGKSNAAQLVNYGVYTYGGGGTKPAGYETYTPITFLPAPQPDKADATVAATTRPVAYGAVPSVNATVSSKVAATGAVIVKEGAKTLGRANLSKGRAVVALPKNLRVGKHALRVEYPGSATVKSAHRAVNLDVVKATAKARLKVVSTPTRKKGGRVDVGVSVTPAQRPTGTVTLQVRNAKNKLVRTIRRPVNTKSVAAIAVPRLGKGTYRLVATYSGSATIKAVVARGALKVRR